jgi:gliding motility-associated lipoprotein GldD
MFFIPMTLAMFHKTATLIVISAFSSLFIACSGDYTPKPKGYFRIELPKKSYIHYVSPSCPFAFDVPVYANMQKEERRQDEPCFVNMYFPQFKATLYLTYKDVGETTLEKLTEESRSFAYKHTIKADGINESLISTKNQVHGILYDIEGNSASSLQFYVTDSSKHFLRGALYFYAHPSADSIAPVLHFIRQDVAHLLETFEWEK